MGTAARAYVKYFSFIAFLLLLLWPRTAFADLPASITEDLPDDVRTVLEQADGANDRSLLQMGWDSLRETAVGFLAGEARRLLRGTALLLGIVLVCNLFQAGLQATGDGTVPNYVPLAGTLAVTGLAAGELHSLGQLCADTIEQLHILSETLLPAMAAAMTASGGALTATARQMATVFFSELLISAIHRVFLPLVYVFIAVSAADSMLREAHLKPLADAIKKTVSWALAGGLVLFTGYLSLTGAAAGSGDRVALQMTRSAISAAVPVVGTIISEASETLLAGANTLKSTLGIAGMLAVLSICIVPFLTLLTQYLLYKAAAFLSGICGDLLTELLHALGDAYALLLGMTGSCAALLLIAATTSVSVVIV